MQPFGPNLCHICMPTMKIADSELVERVLGGEKRAFRLIIHQNKRLVCHVIYRMVKNEQDKEDLIQEVFLRVYQNLGRFEQKAKLSTWIARIAFNTTLNYLEKKRVPLYEDMCGEGESIETCPDRLPSPDDTVESRQSSVSLSVEIDKLPIHYGLILSLYHLQEMSYREISEVMRLPDGTVKSYLFRARKMLKERLTTRYTREELCA